MGFEKMKDKAAEDLKQFRKLEGSSDQTERQDPARRQPARSTGPQQHGKSIRLHKRARLCDPG